jgi:hypothetical protein
VAAHEQRFVGHTASVTYRSHAGRLQDLVAASQLQPSSTQLVEMFHCAHGSGSHEADDGSQTHRFVSHVRRSSPSHGTGLQRSLSTTHRAGGHCAAVKLVQRIG